MNKHLPTLLLSSVLALAALPAMGLELEGVKLEERIKLGGTELQLNGAGVRSRAFFKGYVIGLYLPEKKGEAEAAIAAAGPKRIRVVPLRDLSADTVADAFSKSLRKNLSDEDQARMKPRLDEFHNAMLALGPLRTGAVLELDQVPGGGTRYRLNGEAKGKEIPGEDFYAALMRIWIGKSPTQEDLKEKLLGR